MIFFKFLKTKTLAPCIAILLLLSFILAPISQTLTVKRAEALVVFDPTVNATGLISAGAAVVSAAANSVASAATAALDIKEFTLDTIAWALVNIMLEEMIRSVTMWVNSGFQGSPAFLRDFKRFLLNIADQYAGNFIYGAGLSMLCSPFKLDLQLALDLSYQRTRGYQSQCRLSSVVKNVDKFLGGDFREGGWDGWFSINTDPENSPYGAMYQASGELTLTLQNARGEQIKLLEFGNGFLSKLDPSGKITHPGSVIQTQLNKSLGLPADRLTIADELNELVGALLAQLAKTVLTGASGLLGVSEPDYKTGKSYLDRMRDETLNSTLGDKNTISTLSNAVKTEEKVGAQYKTILSMLTTAENYKNTRYGKDATCHSGELTPSLKEQLETAREEATTTARVAKTLTDLRSDYMALESATTSAATTTSILGKYVASSAPDAKLKIMEKYMELMTSREIHQEPDIERLRFSTKNNLEPEITEFITGVDTACRLHLFGTGI